MFKLKNLGLSSIFDKENMNYGSKIELIKKEDLKEGDKLPIYSDTFFHAMFSNTNRLKYLCKFLSYFFEDVTCEELEKVTTLVKNEEDKTNDNDKARRVDLLAQVGDMKINLEVNNCATKETMERNLEYLCRLYGEQVTSGKSEEHAFCIQFNLNNFAPTNGRDFEICCIRTEEGRLAFEKFIIVQIYLPALEKKYKKLYNRDINKLTEKERFLLMLMTTNEKESKRLCVKGDKIMEEYQTEAKEVSHNKAVLNKYSKEWEDEQRAKEREYIGEERGYAKGIEQSRKEIAKKMLEKNMDIEDIVEISSLSKEEVEEIKKDLKS